MLAAWPRSAQLATAFLLGVVATLLAVHARDYLPRGGRPSVLDRSGEQTYRVDLNRADRAELLQLPGVGDSLAGRIEAHRRQRGPFRDVDQLGEVKGVGPATLDRLRDWVLVEEAAPGLATPPRSRTSGVKGVKKDATLTEPVNVNRANLEELQRLPGIGPKTAERIIEARRQAPFRSVEDLRRVPRIGPKTLERLRPLVIVEDGAAQRVASEE